MTSEPPSSKSSTIHSALYSHRASLSLVKVWVTETPVVRFSMVAVPASSLVAMTELWIESPAETVMPLKSMDACGYHSYQAS